MGQAFSQGLGEQRTGLLSGRVWSADERAHGAVVWDRGWTSATHQAPLVLNDGQTEHSAREGET